MGPFDLSADNGSLIRCIQRTTFEKWYLPHVLEVLDRAQRHCHVMN
jgi:hypothetical protein